MNGVVTSREQNLVAVENAWWDDHHAEMAEPTGFFSLHPQCAGSGRMWVGESSKIARTAEG
jgi:hypothetical protein